MLKKFTAKRGSALVMSLLFMMILIVLSFSVNYMLINEIRAERNFLSGAKAYYAAEAGLEDALLNVSLQDAGAAVESKADPVMFVEDAVATYPNLVSDSQNYSYDVISRSTEYTPCDFERPDTLHDTFGMLRAGESAVIPLDSVSNFQVDYYVLDTTSPFDVPSFVMQNKDVLRWQIVGNRNTGVNVFGDAKKQGAGKVEAISEYFPISSINNNYHDNPTSFGTSAELEYAWAAGKYYDIIDGATFDSTDLLYIDLEDYLASSGEGGFHYIFHSQYPLIDFLNGHNNEMLVLTNILNVVSPSQTEEVDSIPAGNYELYYRVHDGLSGRESESIACTAVKVEADGISPDGKFVQSVDVIKPLDQGIPVTDFVWYQKD
ncbi:hypothetical protein HOG48_04445 [Candidatus Peregrinibacteria bacterium]|jgi:hypothetical protein|nr:hypothetical protein [Candidatus Peregrinibacteria bacterium]